MASATQPHSLSLWILTNPVSAPALPKSTVVTGYGFIEKRAESVGSCQPELDLTAKTRSCTDKNARTSGDAVLECCKTMISPAIPNINQ